jgi:hypothetical protein
MRERLHLLLVISVFVSQHVFPALARGQQPNSNPPIPEMQRLIRAFQGSYTTVERHQPTQEFPHGGIRTGRAVIRAAAGGNAMTSEVHSHAPEGDLDYLGIFWWDPSAQVYRLLMCAKQFPEGCLSGATARWEGDKLVRTREVNDNGKKIVLRDTISFPPDGYINLAEVSVDGGPMKEEIRTKATRQRSK